MVGFLLLLLVLLDVDVVEVEEILLKIVLQELIEEQRFQPIVVVLVLAVGIQQVEEVIVQMQQRRE